MMFEPFIRAASRAAPLPAANIDTDVIIRIERLTGGKADQLGKYAFEALRYREDGSENPDFAFNQAKWRGARILLAGPNFGCGSSREPAVNALLAMGLRCIIAESFGDIFYANCFQNGLLPIRVSREEVERMMAVSRREDSDFVVDLADATVTDPNGCVTPFEVDRRRRVALLEGLDDIGLTLRHSDAIRAWQASDRLNRPWIWKIKNRTIA